MVIGVAFFTLPMLFYDRKQSDESDSPVVVPCLYRAVMGVDKALGRDWPGSLVSLTEAKRLQDEPETPACYFFP